MVMTKVKKHKTIGGQEGEQETMPVKKNIEIKNVRRSCS